MSQLAPPERKDPQKQMRVALLPPLERSRAAQAWTACVAEGRFALQVCETCGATTYPPRDACPKCLGQLVWRDVAPFGALLAESILHISQSLYFRARTPLRIGTIGMVDGPAIIAHLHDKCHVGDRVRLMARLDRGGHAVMIAVPAEELPAMETDAHLRDFTCSPKYRRILITDGRHPATKALARALLNAGASQIYVGFPDGGRTYSSQASLKGLANIDIVSLDATDSKSVATLAGSLGAKVDILINTGDHKRAGRLLERRGIVAARDEMETNYFGLMRFAQSFGPVMSARGADGVNNAVAWVNIFSVYALANWPKFASYHASHAAALSLSQGLRADLREGGIRVINALTGPLDDEWNQEVPPPKVRPGQLVRAIIDALAAGTEDVFVGDVAREVAARWKDNPKVLELELRDF